MIFHKYYRVAYAYLAIYILVTLIFSGPVMILEIILTLIVAFIVLIFLATAWKSAFYAYIFFALLMLTMDFTVMKMNLETVAEMYMVMFLLLMHIVEMHFRKYGKIRTDTYMIYVLSLPLSFVTVLMAFYTPRFGGIAGIMTLSLIVVILYYLIVRVETAE